VPAFGLIPERLVTIRGYSSTESAAADCRLLIDAGIDAYIRIYRWQDIGEVRVPESQVERAMTLLSVPQLELSAGVEHAETCTWCGGRYPRTFAPFTGLVLAAGGGLIGWAIYLGQYDSGAATAGVTLVVLFFMKTIAGRLVCADCGRDWRAPKPAPDPDSEG
jgi:hypothetical protein